MKPGTRDVKVHILITGVELAELQRRSWQMVEAFGLDSRIEEYKGTRPIGLYQWDMDCLIDVISMALDDKDEYPSQESPRWASLKNLYTKLKNEYQRAYSK
ncbi:MAG: hypothetical protein PF904_14615 [Kiritimatiellae bacterium]|jgi:hypothetical protein|nr:hypothetical protein [Kiritimatiellia bacterium]